MVLADDTVLAIPASPQLRPERSPPVRFLNLVRAMVACQAVLAVLCLSFESIALHLATKHQLMETCSSGSGIWAGTAALLAVLCGAAAFRTVRTNSGFTVAYFVVIMVCCATNSVLTYYAHYCLTHDFTVAHDAVMAEDTNLRHMRNLEVGLVAVANLHTITCIVAGIILCYSWRKRDDDLMQVIYVANDILDDRGER